MNVTTDSPRRYYSPPRTAVDAVERPASPVADAGYAAASYDASATAHESNPSGRTEASQGSGFATVRPYDLPPRASSTASVSGMLAGMPAQSGLNWHDGNGPAIRPQAAYDRAGPPSRSPHLSVDIDTTCRNVIACTSASGGAGLSTFAAMLAHRLAERGLPCALVDADFTGGGLDMLIGIENEEGERFETLDAPLGRLEGEALNRELPEWDGVRVLSFDPWNGPVPNWWQAQAAVRALSEANHAVIVDAGRGEALHGIAEIGDAAQLVVVELSVLGLARASSHIGRLRERVSGDDVIGDRRSTPFVVGIAPRGTAKGTGVVDVREAADYLGLEIAGPVKANRRLCSDILSGLGIRLGSRATRRTVDRAAGWAESLLGGGTRSAR
ncbi:P-loop NTPase [Bifidobacterium sp. 82T10]|uniref:P-loop NTPase n=1 Tax=Bifidobacterium miconis TaxID=2834435 RepID=A0ABS6WGM7_9BIFI|nr:P-loop NTPase [Bifidobacterium miconis]MBW3093027.1 P-loop NTPase [Bifidobacterium miconis]